MHAWHFLEPALKMGLKYCATFFCPDLPPWKLKAHTEPEYYSCVDSDAALRCLNGIKAMLIEQGRWETFLRHFVELGTILRRMGAGGICVNREKRRASLLHFESMYANVQDEIDDLVPNSVKGTKLYTFNKERLQKEGLWDEKMALFPVQVPRSKATKREMPCKCGQEYCLGCPEWYCDNCNRYWTQQIMGQNGTLKQRCEKHRLKGRTKKK